MSTELNKSGKEEIDLRRIEVVDRASAEIMRRLSGGEKMRLACQMGDRLRRMVRRQVEREHPEWTEEQVRRELARRAGHGSAELAVGVED